MKPQDYELSQDLAWMLISGQVSDDFLLEALYQEFYKEAFHLCIASLDNHELAVKTTQEIFASAIINRYRYKAENPIRFWFLQISLDTISRIYNNLNLKRTITANLPFQSDGNLYGDSTPATAWDAEIWLTLDQLEFNKRLLALALFYFRWEDTEITAIFNMSLEELNLNKRYLNSVLLPFRMENSTKSKISLENRIIQSLSLRWPDVSIPAIDLNLFTRQVTHQLRMARIKNRFSVSSKEIFLTGLIILMAATSIWGYNHYFPEELPATPELQYETAPVLATQTGTPNVMKAPTSPAKKSSEIEEIIYTIRTDDSLMSIAKQFNVNFYGLRRNNRIPGETDIQARQKLWLFSDPGNVNMNLTKYLAQHETEVSQEKFAYQQLPLIRRLETSISTNSLMWLEGMLIQYGPEAYIGPPKIEIVQAWLTPDKALYLIGNEQQELQEVWLLEEQHQYMATPGTEQPWTHAWKPINLDSKYLNSLKLFSDTLSGNPDFSPIVMEISDEEYIWLGRQTTGYDFKDIHSVLHERHWVDNETKINIRRQIFKILEPTTITKEVIITKLEEGNNAPVGLLDPRIPWRGGFALNYLSQPASMNKTLIFPDQLSQRARLEADSKPKIQEQFDFSQAQLTFQYPQILPDTHRIPVEIFVENQYLGTAELGNPWTMICNRSPDGNMLAYVSQPGTNPNQASRLQLVDLRHPDNKWQLLPTDMGIESFAFSPDSKFLAVFGYTGSFTEGILIILEVGTGRSYWVDYLGEVSSLAWSPNGKQIALIARYQNSSFLEEIFIYNHETGEIVYRQPLDFSNPQPVDWPTEEWGIEFPVEMGNLSVCSTAPQKAP